MILFLLPLASASDTLVAGTSKNIVLDNGFRVVMLDMDSPGVVAVQTWVGVGSRNEVAAGTTGFAHFFEHLMFYGSPALPREARDLAVMRTGADENAWTWFDDTVYHSVVAADQALRMLEIEADRFQGLALRPEDVEKESGAVYGEYRKSHADPTDRLIDALFAAAFTTHTYHHPTIGWEEDIRAMPGRLDLARGFFDTWYRPDNCRLILVGDLDLAATEARVRELYGGWARGPARPALPVEPPQVARRDVQVPWDGAPTQARLAMGWKIPGFDPDSDASAAALLVENLLFSEVAPLRRDLVEKRQIVLDLWGGDWQSADPHLFLVYAELREPGDRDAVEQAVLGELNRLGQGIAPAELDAVRKATLRSLTLELVTPSAVASRLGLFTRGGGGAERIDTFAARIRGITPEVLSATVRAFAVDAGLTVGVLR